MCRAHAALHERRAAGALRATWAHAPGVRTPARHAIATREAPPGAPRGRCHIAAAVARDALDAAADAARVALGGRAPAAEPPAARAEQLSYRSDAALHVFCI